MKHRRIRVRQTVGIRLFYTPRVIITLVLRTENNSLLHVAAMPMTMRVTVISGEKVQLCANAEAGSVVG